MNSDTPNGVANINKPLGLSSHDVVARVREATGVRRVGHAGTLDPLATGVLLVCVGRTATRLVEYLVKEPKTYRTDVQLGAVTDTFDADGKILASAPVDVSRDDVERSLRQFQGTIKQVPPMYSAVKHEGKPLYRLARRGIEVQREARTVEIFRLTMTKWDDQSPKPQCTLEMECSSGTYVRVLVHDLGQVLGCGAYVRTLTRLGIGSFRLRDAITLDEFLQAAAGRNWADLLVPVDQVLADRFPALHLDEDEAWRLCSGQRIGSVASHTQTKGLTRVYGPRGHFLALAVFDGQENVWIPRKVFVSPARLARSERAD